jgi:hypothetical protein
MSLGLYLLEIDCDRVRRTHSGEPLAAVVVAESEADAREQVSDRLADARFSTCERIDELERGVLLIAYAGE